MWVGLNVRRTGVARVYICVRTHARQWIKLLGPMSCTSIHPSVPPRPLSGPKSAQNEAPNESSQAQNSALSGPISALSGPKLALSSPKSAHYGLESALSVPKSTISGLKSALSNL